MSGTGQRGIVERLRDGTVLGAEGYVFELERRGYIKAGPYVPEVVLDFPGAVTELHREFLRAGADVMVALTYYAHREKLRVIGREGDLEAMNRQAVRIARAAAREGGALVAGNVCNTWAYDPDDASTAAAVRAMYAEQLGWAAEEGIDFVISETNDYLGEALIALEVIQELGLPAMRVFFLPRDQVEFRGNWDVVISASAGWLVTVLFLLAAWELLMMVAGMPGIAVLPRRKWVAQLETWLVPAGLVAGLLFGHYLWE